MKRIRVFVVYSFFFLIIFSFVFVPESYALTNYTYNLSQSDKVYVYHGTITQFHYSDFINSGRLGDADSAINYTDVSGMISVSLSDVSANSSVDSIIVFTATSSGNNNHGDGFTLYNYKVLSGCNLHSYYLVSGHQYVISVSGSQTFNYSSSGYNGASSSTYNLSSSSFSFVFSGSDGWQDLAPVFSPNIDIGDVSVDCDGHSVSVSLAANFDLTSVDSVFLGSSPVQYSFNPNTGILYIPNVVFNSFSYPSSVPLDITGSGTNPNDGSSVSASASTNIDVSSCSTATANKTYRIGIDVKCGIDSGGHYYNIQVTFFLDGSRVSDYTASYTSTPNGGSDSDVVASQFGDTYNISGRPVDDIDNYVITIHYDGKDFQAELKNPQCGDSFNYDYDSSGNLIKKSINSLLSILKDILEQIKSFIKTIFDFFKLVYALFNLSLSILSAFVKNAIPFLIDVVNVSVAFLNALTNPVSDGSLNLPTTATFFGVSINGFASSIHSSILLIESYVPTWLWWIFAGWSFLSFIYQGLGTVRVVDKETGEVK